MEATLNQVINARDIFRRVSVYSRPAEFLNSVTWAGTCAEIVDALTGSEAHVVDIVDGVVVIWRKDSQYMPQFIQVDGTGFFFSTTWAKKGAWL